MDEKGPIPTEEERAANYREVHKLSRQDRFNLMFGKTPMDTNTTTKDIPNWTPFTCKKSIGATFDDWFDQLLIRAKLISQSAYQYVKDSKYGWTDYYEDDDTPKEAIDDDARYWE